MKDTHEEKCQECGVEAHLCCHKEGPGSKVEFLCNACHIKRHRAWATSKPRRSISDWAREVVLLLALLVMLWALVILVRKVVVEVETRGLKSIVESIWYGEDKR